MLSLNYLTMTTVKQVNNDRIFFCFLYPSGDVKLNLLKGSDAGMITCISHPAAAAAGANHHYTVHHFNMQAFKAVIR